MNKQELTAIVAQLRHAYMLLNHPATIHRGQIVGSLLSQQIKRLEKAIADIPNLCAGGNRITGSGNQCGADICECHPPMPDPSTWNWNRL